MRINGAGWYVPETTIDEPDPMLEQLAECNEQMAAALTYINRHELVVQAGGRIGVWPRALTRFFEQVVTFEPDELNFQCLEANTNAFDSVAIYKLALGRRQRQAYLVPSEQSSGMSYVSDKAVAGARRIQMTTIDSEIHAHGSREVSAIFLDVEGYEIEALAGARETLRAYKPLLVLEENSCCHRYGRQQGELATWLAPFGYRQVAQISKLPPEVQNDGLFRGADLIFVA